MTDGNPSALWQQIALLRDHLGQVLDSVKTMAKTIEMQQDVVEVQGAKIDALMAAEKARWGNARKVLGMDD